MPVGLGNIVFLPNFKEVNEEAFFEACQEYRFGREGTPPPPWVPSIALPGEQAAEDKIAIVNKEIQHIQEILAELRTKRDELIAYKKLLFEKGKNQLEPVVRNALDALGFRTSPAENIPGTLYEIDGRTAEGSLPGILEVKGSKNQISLDEFAPFVTKILADLQNTKITRKGILVGNGFCMDNPASRLGERIFSTHVLDAAKRNSVALVNSAELYWVICGILATEISDLGAIREKILTTNGYVSLKEFCKQSPFKSD